VRTCIPNYSGTIKNPCSNSCIAVPLVLYKRAFVSLLAAIGATLLLSIVKTTVLVVILNFLISDTSRNG